MSGDEEESGGPFGAIEELTYDAQDALFDGDLAQAKALASQAIEQAVSSALLLRGSSASHAAEKGEVALPARLSAATVGAFDVLSSVALQQQDWSEALATSQRWVKLAGPAATIRPFSTGLRAAFCGLCQAERARGAERAPAAVAVEETPDTNARAVYVSGAIALSEALFDRSRQRDLAGGKDGLSAGQLMLEQAQALAQLCDMAVRSSSAQLREHASLMDDALQEFMEAEESGLDALEPHEQGRVAALAAWARCRLTSDETQRGDAMYALDMIADGSVLDAVTSAQAARAARDAAAAGDAADGNAASAAFGKMALQDIDIGPLRLEEDDYFEHGSIDGDLLPPTFKLATDYIPSPLDLGLGFMYALLALGALEAAGTQALQAAVFDALGKALEHGLGDDENVQGVLLLLHQRNRTEKTSLQRAAQSDDAARKQLVWARLDELASNEDLRASFRRAALGSSNVLVQQRMLELL